MRSPNKRSRSKSNRPKTLGNVVNRVFDSSGPEGKVRGTPQQIIEKYQILARDAQLANDRVSAENFQQHAEHYTRMLAQAQREQAAEQEARRQSQEEQRARNEERARHNNANGNNGQQGHGNAQQQPDQPDAARNAPDQASSGAFDVTDTPRETDRALVVDTPENSAASETPGAAPRARNSRKPRAPKSSEDAAAAPKPRRAPRKPRAPQEAGDAPAPEMKPSAAE